MKSKNLIFEFPASPYTDLKIEVVVHATEKSYNAASKKLEDSGDMDPGPSWAFCVQHESGDLAATIHFHKTSLTLRLIAHEASHALDNVMKRQRLADGANDDYVEEIRAETIASIIHLIVVGCTAENFEVELLKQL